MLFSLLPASLLLALATPISSIPLQSIFHLPSPSEEISQHASRELIQSAASLLLVQLLVLCAVSYLMAHHTSICKKGVRAVALLHLTILSLALISSLLRSHALLRSFFLTFHVRDL